MAEIEWELGDRALAASAAGTPLVDARRQVAASFVRGEEEVFRFTAACAAFPPGQRRPSLTFAHHTAALKLPEADRATLLDQAERDRMSPRAFRRAILQHRIDSGDYIAIVDDDPDDTMFRAIARKWNAASVNAREAFAELIGEEGLKVIPL